MNLFTYGTLMKRQTFEQFAQSKYEEQIGTLTGYIRRQVKDAWYPGIIPRQGQKVQGKLYMNVNDKDMKALDKYQGDQYKKINVKIQLTSGKQVDAIAYQFIYPQRLEEGDWDPQNNKCSIQ